MGSQRARVLVVGVGNDLRRDDGIGIVVASAVRALCLPGIHVLTRQQVLPEMVEDLGRCDVAVFVDAAVVGEGVGVGDAAVPSAPGPRVTRVTEASPVAAATPAPAATSGAHVLDAAGLICLAARAGEPVPTAFLVAVPAFDLGFGLGLSARSAALVDDAVASVLALAGHAPAG